MPRQRFDAESVRSVEIEILLESVRVKEIIAHPSCGKRGQLARIKVELDALARAKNDEAIVRGTEQIQHIAVARVVSRGASVGAGHAAIRERVDRVTCRRE